ncbi:hypothetical protein GCM10028774_58450 [Spirosoma jeollabukense]
MNKKPINCLTIICILLTSSCHQGAIEQESGCGCKGKATESVTDVPAQITISAGRYLTLEKAVSTNGAVTRTLFLCDTSMLSGLSTSKTGEYDYLVSGNLRPPCVNTGVVYIWNMELTAIRKK